MTGVYAIVIALSVVIFLLGILVIGLLRSHADILRRLEGIGAGLQGSDHGHESRITLTRPTGLTTPRTRGSGRETGWRSSEPGARAGRAGGSGSAGRPARASRGG